MVNALGPSEGSGSILNHLLAMLPDTVPMHAALINRMVGFIQDNRTGRITFQVKDGRIMQIEVTEIARV